MSSLTATPDLLLPWESSDADDRRFRLIATAALLVFFAVSFTVPLLEVPELLTNTEETPDELTRVLLEPRELPPPEEPEPPPPKPEPMPEPEPVVPPRPTEQAVQPVNQVELARERAQAAGVLAFKDDLMAMREEVDVDSLNQTQTSRGSADAATVERSLVTAANTGSGGIQTASVSRDAGGAALSAREATRVESNITEGTGTATARNRVQNSPDAVGGRSDESIRRMMDRSKGAIYAIYNRALRKDPLLEGKLVFEMVIAPSGEITQLSLISSELRDDDLTQKILARIRMIRFGPEQVLSTRVNYSFDFLPYG